MKKFLSLALVIALLFLLSFTVMAHSGGTDSSGGHYNQGTGEYHYHHGYPAHDHSDTDGDGDLDCPYDFKDKTSYGGTSGGNYGGSASANGNDDFDFDYEDHERYRDKLTFWEVLLAILKIIGLTLMVLLCGAFFVYPFLLILISALLEWLGGKVIKRSIKESTPTVVSIIVYIIIALTISSIAVLKS